VAAWIGAGVLGGGLATGVAVSQLGVATAATPSPKPTASQAPDRPGGPFDRRHLRMFGRHFAGPLPRLAPGLGFGFGIGPGIGLGDRLLHGKATVKGPNGTTQVVATQSGTITGVSGSDLTVRSTDGYVGHYTVDKTTRIELNGADGALSKLKTGDTVHVMAVEKSGAFVATSVLDGKPLGLRYLQRQERRAPQPAPSATSGT
jgi:hypothetical protein